MHTAQGLLDVLKLLQEGVCSSGVGWVGNGRCGGEVAGEAAGEGGEAGGEAERQEEREEERQKGQRLWNVVRPGAHMKVEDAVAVAIGECVDTVRLGNQAG